MNAIAARALRLAPGLLGRLPGRWAEAIGGTAGGLVRSPLGLRRRVAERQIAASFPGRPPGWVERVAREAYRHFGRELAATLSAADRGPAVLFERLENRGRLEEALGAVGAAGRGAVVVTGHIGNWELLGACAGVLGRPLLAVARSHGLRLDAELASIRRALGVETVLEGWAARLPAALAEGALVGLVADQHAGPHGVRVPFLGRPASTHLGPARLALACEVPLHFAALLRDGDAYRLELEEVSRPRGPDAPLRLTRCWVERLERLVRTRPEQYLWSHRRWKPGGRPRPRNAVRGAAVGDACAPTGSVGREERGCGGNARAP